MNKTTLEWFQDLPPRIRDLAIRNTELFRPENLKDEMETLESCILSSFSWKETPEGNDFWWKEFNKVWDGTKTLNF